MRLRPADIDKILEENIPRGENVVSADDYVAENAQARDALLSSLMSQKSTSTARNGEILPLPRRPMSPQTALRPEPRGDQPDFEETPSTQLQKARSFVRQTPRPSVLVGINLDAVDSRTELIRQLIENLPLNELGLPKIIYRSDLLDWQLFRGEVDEENDENYGLRYEAMEDYLHAATVHISYAEGFPALPKGEPLWQKFPFELQERYAAFSSYCLMTGARQIAKMPESLGTQRDLLAWFHEDYWAIRVKCFDMMQAVHAAKQREQRILSIEDSHYLKGEKILGKLEAMFEEINWDDLKHDPEKFVKVLEKATNLQRTALGLMNAKLNQEIRSESIEVTMRKVAQPSALENRGPEDTVSVRRLLQSPEAIASAQELIIRMTQTVQELPEHVDQGMNEEEG